MTADVLLEARQVTKVFPGTLALDGVDFAVRRGQISALAGGNGAGKSTLVKILAGIEQPTSGSLWMDGRPVRFSSAREAGRLGVGIIHQELNLCPNLSVADNIFLGREVARAGLVVDSRAEQRLAGEWLSRLAPGIDPRATLGDLPLGQQQIVEIAKALARDARVLMMDEPTSALSGAEIAALFRLIRDLAARGVGVVYISHRLAEVLEIADSILVLRDGRVVGQQPAAAVDLPWIVERMTGRPAGALFPPRTSSAGSPLLEVRALRVPGQVRQVSFDLAAGELLGIYGLLGAGQTELLEALLGLRPGTEGQVLLEGRPLDRLRPDQRIAAGLALVPEDRQAAGLVQTLSVRENLTLAALGRLTVRFLPFLSLAAEKRAASRLAADLRIRTAGLDRPIVSLSGGNQQKVVIGRFLQNEPKVLLMDEPTRGIDVAARAEIYALMRRLAGQGMGIVFASSELEEVREMADRILVLSRGRLAGEFAAAEATDELLLTAAARAEGEIAC